MFPSRDISASNFHGFDGFSALPQLLEDSTDVTLKVPMAVPGNVLGAWQLVHSDAKVRAAAKIASTTRRRYLGAMRRNCREQLVHGC